MASLIYNSCLDDSARGAIDFDTDAFKTLLVVGYTPNKDTHTKRSDITNEVAAGNGYSTGGVATACTVLKDTTNDRITLTFAAASWANALTASGAVIYKSRGGASSADELVAFVDFGGSVVTSGVSASVITLQN